MILGMLGADTMWLKPSVPILLTWADLASCNGCARMYTIVAAATAIALAERVAAFLTPLFALGAACRAQY